MRILFIGDVVGKGGRNVLRDNLADLKSEYAVDFCIANGENSAGWKGITYVLAKELLEYGVDAITLGNHSWARKEIFNFIDSSTEVIRPANYPKGVPGKGSLIIGNGGFKLGIINLIGRVYMGNADCPFRVADREIKYLKDSTDAILVDFHAEATSEKAALAWYLDGRVACVLGTHTHVQTADERILERGTAFISDVGMTGPYEGILGMEKESIIHKFITGLPVHFSPAKGRMLLNAVVVDVDIEKKKAKNIVRIQRIFKY